MYLVDASRDRNEFDEIIDVAVTLGSTGFIFETSILRPAFEALTFDNCDP